MFSLSFFPVVLTCAGDRRTLFAVRFVTLR